MGCGGGGDDLVRGADTGIAVSSSGQQQLCRLREDGNERILNPSPRFHLLWPRHCLHRRYPPSGVLILRNLYIHKYFFFLPIYAFFFYNLLYIIIFTMFSLFT